jgi:hypothetical protein
MCNSSKAKLDWTGFSRWGSGRHSANSAAFCRQSSNQQTESAPGKWWVAIALITIVAQSMFIQQGIAQSCFAMSAALDGQTSDSQTGAGLSTVATPPPTAAPSKNPSTPVVTYQNGELTIEAHHSALSEILRAVSMQTGAAIDFPPGVDRPVGGHIGPGQAIGVLARMLNSLGCDYAILASVASPKVPVRVILFTKPVISTPTKLVQGPPPDQMNAGLSTDAAVVEEASGDIEIQQQEISQHWATIQQDLMDRLNARGKQLAEGSH